MVDVQRESDGARRARARGAAGKRLAVVGVVLGSVASVLQLTGALPAAAARTITVAQDGSGDYTTIQAAANAATAGDTVTIAGGTYRESVVVRNSGREGADIVFRNRGTERVVIDGEGTRPSTGNGLLSLDGRSYVRILGLTVTNSRSHGIYGGYAHHVNVESSTVSYTRNGGIFFGDGSDVMIKSNDVHHTNQAGLGASNEAISLNNVKTFWVQNNRVHDNREEGIDAKYESSNGSIFGNDVYANNGPNIYLDSVHDIRVLSNRVDSALGSTKSGIGLAIENYSSTRKMYDIDIANNVVTNNDGGVGFWIESSGQFSDIRIVNNSFVSNRRGGISIANGGTGVFGGTNLIRNNIFWGNSSSISDGSGARSKFSIDHNLFKSGESSATQGSSAVVTGDVRFANLANKDFRLQSSSPAVDAAASGAAPLEDYAGNSRPSGNGFDIGAFEFGGQPPVVTVPTVPTTAQPTAIKRLLLNTGGPSTYFGATQCVPGACNGYLSGGTKFAVSSSRTIHGAWPGTEELYRSEVFGNAKFRVPLKAGKYNVTLHFAEIWWTSPGQRLFDVSIENGAATLSNYDIVARAGGANRAKAENFTVEVKDGALDIQLISKLDNAKVSAIDISPAG